MLAISSIYGFNPALAMALLNVGSCSWRACCHNNTVELVFGNILLDICSCPISEQENWEIPYPQLHPASSQSKAFQLNNVQDACDIQAAVTDINTNGHRNSNLIKSGLYIT